MFFSLRRVGAVGVTDATGEIPEEGEVGDLDKDDMVGVNGGGGGGVSEIIVDGLDPK